MKQIIAALVCLAAVSCRQAASPGSRTQSVSAQATDPLAIVLSVSTGTNRIDQEIARMQQQVRARKNFEMSLERLGWAFVLKARESFDPGFYKLAEQCALSLEAVHAGSLEGMLLRGHVLHNLHRFKEAEPLACELVARRGLPVDFGLLSDVLMEQGKLDEAAEACQKMIDLRPDLHSYARGAHLRWLKGNVAGALDLMAMAASAASPRDPESAAWVNTRLAGYAFQSGEIAEAEIALTAALDFEKDYPPALLLRGRMLLAQGNAVKASEVLHRAAELNPLPEYQWTLAEALAEAGKPDESASVEAEMSRKATAADPRTYAVYLATRKQSVPVALHLARTELGSRADVFTHDALAWALLASGNCDEARRQSFLALSQGTKDARLFLHAAVIARITGNDALATQYATRAAGLKQMLLPSERRELDRVVRASGARVAAQTETTQKPLD